MSTIEDHARSVFLRAFERSPEQWPAFVSESCGDNAELRARVDQLLSDHQALGSIHDGGAPAATAHAPPLECVGTLIGPYKLLEQIGEGGMGLVFVAEQQQPVRRKVALKLIKPGMDSRQVIARFEAERQALAMMNHPNIAKVHDGGATPGGRPYFVMELVKGTPITEYCDRNRLDNRGRLELFLDVCQAVQHAHHKGIIHRDLKPSNILVEVHDVRPVVKIIDFGIAKAVGQQLTTSTLYTGIAQLIGTPLYMSPEQAGLSSLDVDTRSDVYALGVLLYELLTGTTPFDGETLKRAGYDEMRRIIREDEPPKPSARLSTLHDQLLSTIAEQRGMQPQLFDPQVRGELDWIVMKSLEKDRNRRYETASAFSADVERYLNDEPVEACPPSRRYRLGKFLRKHRRGALTATALLVAALVVGAGIGWVALDRADRRAEVERQQAVAEQAVDAELTESEIWQGQEQWDKALQILERAKVRLAGSALHLLQTRVEERRRNAALVVRLEEAHRKASMVSSDCSKRDYAGADRAYVAAFTAHGLDGAALSAEEIARQIKASAIRTQLVTALDYWAHVRERLPKGDGEPLRAIARLADDNVWRQQLRNPQLAKDRKALERLAIEESVLRQPPANLLILSYLLDKADAQPAVVRLLRGAQERYPADFWINLELGVNLCDKSNKPAEGVGFMRVALALQPNSPVVYQNLSVALGKQKLLSEAEAAARKAIELKLDYAPAYNSLGFILHDQQKFPEAEAAYRRAIELDPDFAVAYSNLGSALGDQKKFTEAEAAHRKAIDLKPDYAAAYNNLGGTLYKQRKLPEAEAAYRRAIELDSDFAVAYNNLGSTLCMRSKLPEGEAAFRKAIELDPNYAKAYDGLGTALGDQKKFTEAEAAHRKAIELDPNSAAAYSNLGGTLYKQGKLPEAEAAFRKAMELNPDKAELHYNLGITLRAQGKLPEAETAFREAMELNPDKAELHYNLGITLRAQGKLPEAETAYRRAIALESDYAEAHCNLASVLQSQGQFVDSVAYYKRGHELGSRRPDWQYPSAEWIAKAERLVLLDGKLPRILAGEILPADAAECLALSDLCHLPCRRLHAATARFYAEAFAAVPKLANDLATRRRYNAACAAALAGCGQGKDAAKLEADECIRLRGQALAWLRDDLTAYRSMLAKERSKVGPRMQHWQQDSDFAGVRGDEALAKLPEAERREWQRLWEEVEELERRAAAPEPQKSVK